MRHWTHSFRKGVIGDFFFPRCCMMISTLFVLLVGTVVYFPQTIRAFGWSHPHHHLHRRRNGLPSPPLSTSSPSLQRSWSVGYRRLPTTTTPTTTNNVRSSHPSSTVLFENKLWDRMEIEEDEEKLWYCLNCVAGLEMDLLRQCRQRCREMEDVEKFVVPMVTTVRSHGANRMVKDTKVRYDGYVFAKLRLCPKTYEAIQGLDLCRSWMGTINIKGHRKLPPSPLCMNEDEIEKFGLEECEAEEESKEDDHEHDGVILDEGDEPTVDPELEETVQNVYLGLRVGDMVKVTAKNKFFNEDAVVRRLKNKQLFLRFFTYGSMYEEWMNPGDVRKLTDQEVLKGLSGPQQPITQRDIDGPSRGEERGRFQDDHSRRNMVSNFGGEPNRRQGRNAERYDRENPEEMKRSNDNWNAYKDNERRGQGGFDDGEYEMQGSKPERGDKWALSDVDSQWGRTSQRQDRREKRKAPASEADDWSAFVSTPGAKDQPSQKETDDFFASLMTDLSNDITSERRSKQGTKTDSKASMQSSSDDDFFASLMSEIENDKSAVTNEKPQSNQGTTAVSKQSSSGDDFFASLMSEIETDELAAKVKKSETKPTSSDDGFFASLMSEIEEDASSPPVKKSQSDFDDFFASLDDMGQVDDVPTESRGEDDGLALNVEEEGVRPKKKSAADELGNLFSELGTLDEKALTSSPPPGESEDSFVEFTANRESQPSSSGTPEKERVAPSSRSRQVGVSTVDKSVGLDLGERTVPELKELLRERGLKVSGKKSELIERLTSA